MSFEQLGATCVQLKRELAPAIESKHWKSCRADHIDRLLVEVGTIENELEGSGIRDDVFVALISGTIEVSHGCAH